MSAKPDAAAQHDASLAYRRLRSPNENKATLELPPLAQTDRLWQRNRNLLADQPDIQIGRSSLQQLRRKARAELIDLATQYSRQYRDINLAGRDDSQVVMSGHQPELFHPGVWFKNFSLASLANRFGAIPINLVVDNDLGSSAAIKFPRWSDRKASVGIVDIDAPTTAMPHEFRRVQNTEQLRTFADRAAAEIAGTVNDPLVHQLWPHVMERVAAKTIPDGVCLGELLAAGRHRLEADFGLQTLEVPVSQMASLPSFASFAASIMQDQQRFNEIYNGRLKDYRQLHNIRSTAHPVPELETDGDWTESPFWIYSDRDPVRKRMFVREHNKLLQLTDRAGWSLELSEKTLDDSLAALPGTGVCLRPRALTNTLYCRLILSDLFLHGIGGAKYDQLTDAIAADFFRLELPGFSTLSATFRLPFEPSLLDATSSGTIKNQLRDLVFHPERHIQQLDETAKKLIQQKQAAIRLDDTSSTRQRHEAIEACNAQLQTYVADQIAKLSEQLAAGPENLRRREILGSREYSFCLFPEKLTQQLSELANVRSTGFSRK